MSAPATAVENEPDKLVRVGLLIVGLVCVVISGDTLVHLAQRAEWDGWRAYMLPVLIDLPGFLGGRIWLRRARTSDDTRRYARGLTLAALGTSIVGNVVGHLVAAGYLTPGVALVIVTGVVAPVVLWAVLHLDALLTPTVAVPVPAEVAAQDETPAPVLDLAAEPSQDEPVDRVLAEPSQDEDDATASRRQDATAPQDEDAAPSPSWATTDAGTDEVRLQRARHIDQQHRAEHGRHISRDNLASALKIGKTPASELLRILKAEAA